MGALTIADLTPMAGEPRVSDRRLSETLGFDRETRVRELVARRHDEIAQQGEVFHRSLRRNPGDRGRPPVEYLLNEAQALLVCMFARTEKAAAVRKQVIEVFLAWRRGELTENRPAFDVSAEILRRFEGRLAALEALGARLSQVADDPRSTTLALTHSPDIWAGQVRAVRPRWWADMEVRELVLTTHRQMTIDAALALIVAAVGCDRAPSRTALGRFWKRLDRLKAALPSTRMH